MHFVNSLKVPVAVLTASVAANMFTTIVFDNISYSITSTTVIIPITETQLEYAYNTLENTYTYQHHGKITNQDINLDYARLNDQSSIYEWRLEYENLQNGDIEMDNTLKELLEKVNKLEANVELLKSVLDKIENKIETMSEKLSEKVNKLEANVELLKPVPDKIETMSKEISAIKVDVDYLKKFFSLLIRITIIVSVVLSLAVLTGHTNIKNLINNLVHALSEKLIP